MELLKFIKENKKNWQKLITEYPYFIKIKEEGGFILLKYQQTESKTDWSNKIVQECRGIILNKHTLKPVCVPFYRFFNLGEPYAADVNFKKAQVLEKVDGSIIKLWYVEDENGGGEWHISTNGTIDAFSINLSTISGITTDISFGTLVYSLLKEKNFFLKSYFSNLSRLMNEQVLLEKATHMFELVSPYNRVVINYDEPNLYYLGSRSNIDFKEYKSNTLSFVLDTPKSYTLNEVTEEVLRKFVSDIDKTGEGVVVVDNNYNRLKVKNLDYVLMSKVKHSITDADILRIIAKGEEDEFIATVSDKHIESRLEYCKLVIKYMYFYIAMNSYCSVSSVFKEMYGCDITNAQLSNRISDLANDRSFKRNYYLFLKENEFETYILPFMLNLKFTEDTIKNICLGDGCKNFVKKTFIPFERDKREEIKELEEVFNNI